MLECYWHMDRFYITATEDYRESEGHMVDLDADSVRLLVECAGNPKAEKELEEMRERIACLEESLKDALDMLVTIFDLSQNKDEGGVNVLLKAKDLLDSK